MAPSIVLLSFLLFSQFELTHYLQIIKTKIHASSKIKSCQILYQLFFVLITIRRNLPVKFACQPINQPVNQRGNKKWRIFFIYDSHN